MNCHWLLHAKTSPDLDISKWTTDGGLYHPCTWFKSSTVCLTSVTPVHTISNAPIKATYSTFGWWSLTTPTKIWLILVPNQQYTIYSHHQTLLYAIPSMRKCFKTHVSHAVLSYYICRSFVLHCDDKLGSRATILIWLP
jgi:hypothetical protein